MAFAEKSETPAYLLSIFIGFGSGHTYAESPKSTTFLIAELGSLAVTDAGAGIYLSAIGSAYTGDYSATLSKATTSIIITGIGGVIMSAARIWKVVDIFETVETHKAQASSQVSARQSMSTRKASRWDSATRTEKRFLDRPFPVHHRGLRFAYRDRRPVA